MKLVIFILLTIGIFFVVYGVYEEKLRLAQERVRVEYRFVPRSYYDEQLFDNQFKSKLAPIFEEDSAWYDRNIGREMGFDRMKRNATTSR